MACKRSHHSYWDEDGDSSSEQMSDEESNEESDSSNKENSIVHISSSVADPKSFKKFKKDETEYPDGIEILKEALSKAPPSGQYSASGEAGELPTMLGLHIKNFGDVSLPINALQAEELIKKCVQAPYGHNFDTLVNTEVRDSYQLEQSSIEIKNPDWSSKLQELVDRVCTQLGCRGKAEAKLYKLLLYKTGGHFKKHRDTEKDQNMFATLVLQLPSIHTGGDLVIHNPDKSTTIHDFGKSSNNAAFEIHYAGHYADAEHELTEITSGYRLALVYSLCWINGNGICTFNSEDHGLHQALDKLKNKDKIIGIMLEHRYTPRSFQQNGIGALKGIDNDRYNMLHYANQKLKDEEKFDFNLVHACLTVETYDVSGNYSESYGYNEYNASDYEWEENERFTEIKEWYDSDGKLKANLNKVSFSSRIFDYVIDVNRHHVLLDDDFRHEKTFGKKDMHDEIDGYTGNEGLNRTTVYNRYLMILMPKTHQFELYCKANLSFAIEYLGTAYDSMPIESFTEKLRKCVMQLSRDKMILDSSLVTILKLLPKTGDLPLVKLFFSKLPRIGDGLLKGFVYLILTFGWNELEDSFGSLLNQQNYIFSTSKLVKIMIELNQFELALKFCEKFLLPIFDDVNYFKRLTSLYCDTLENHFFAISDTLLLFKRPDFEEYLKKLIQMLTDMNLSGDSIKNFVQTINNNFEFYKVSPSVLSLIQMRINFLEAQIRPSLEFSWRMNATIHGHPRFEQFLKSDDMKMVYSGVLNGVAQARRFISSYSGIKKDFSVYMNYTGTGSRVIVHITKTRDYFDSRVKNLKTMKSELEDLKKLIKS